MPKVRQLVGPHLLVDAPFEVDAKQAADLIVLRARDMTIGCRIRRPGYAERYPYEFTIRAGRDSGAKTELAKIIEGWGDWLFYGHADDFPPNPGISRWMLVDLHAWRAHAIMANGKRLGRPMDNGDGTRFVAYDVTAFGPEPPILIAASFPWHAASEAA